MLNKYKFLFIASSVLFSSIVVPVASENNKVEAESLAFDNSSQANFVKSIAPTAKTIAASADLYASIMIAQATLESGYGASKLAVEANNLFGLKTNNNWTGDVYEISSLEYDSNNNPYYEVSKFKKFHSLEECLTEYTKHWSQSPWYENYYKGIKKSDSTSYKSALKAIEGKYATDPNYITKLESLISKYDLTQYDGDAEPVIPEVVPPVENENTTPETENPSINNPSEEVVTPEPPSTPIPEENKVVEIPVSYEFTKETNANGQLIHTVKQKQTAYGISNLYKISIGEMKEWNHLSSTDLYVGQKLIVSAPPKESSAHTETHIVKSGETLYKISTIYSTSVSEIQKLNKLNGTNIKVGQNLLIPGASKESKPAESKPVESKPTPVKPTETKPVESKPTTTTAVKHLVVKGDTLNKISKKYNVSVKEIQSLNGLKNAVIQLGQTLVIKKGTSNNNVSEFKPSTSNITYKVLKGDTLNKISKKHNVTVKEIQSLNGLKNTNIKIGQTLIIKKGTSTSTATNSSSNTTIATSSISYKVVKGDTLNKISKKYNVAVKEIKSLNNLKNSNIKVGQTLIIKKGTSVVTKVSSKTSVSNNYKINTYLLNIRSSASTSSKIIGTYHINDKVTVSSISNGWGKVSYKGKTGYISMRYAKKA